MYVNSLSIVIPVYNSEASLEALLARLGGSLPALSENYEVILVNDGSLDRSWEKIAALSQEYSWLHAINMMRNYGQHNALLAGVRAAQYEFIITMDDDLQHPPEELHLLLEKLDEGHDVVYGTPQHEQHGLWRDIASQVTKLALQSAMGAETARKVSALRAFRTRLRDAFENYQGPFVSIDVLLTWATTRFASVPVRHDLRLAGKSNYTFRKLVIHALNMMTGFSVLPLQLASMLGFLFALFGGIVLIYVLGRYIIQGGSVPGFPFLASTIAIFSGVQLFALGIIGEYLARMHFRMMDKPSYVIREEIIPGGEPSHESI
ncbi:MAG TPA: glycosyltransferase family 2 protein [Anaerolineales bacterium]|nr:glycosyltransferase family 2 protein [Anaerolineales bacterium]